MKDEAEPLTESVDIANRNAEEFTNHAVQSARMTQEETDAFWKKLEAMGF